MQSNYYCPPQPSVSFSSCQRNLIKTFQIEAMIALITKIILIFFGNSKIKVGFFLCSIRSYIVVLGFFLGGHYFIMGKCLS